MKMIHAAALAAAAFLSTAASATEATQNGFQVRHVSVERSVSGGYQALAQATMPAQTGWGRQTVTDPAHAATSGK